MRLIRASIMGKRCAYTSKEVVTIRGTDEPVATNSPTFRRSNLCLRGELEMTYLTSHDLASVFV